MSKNEHSKEYPCYNLTCFLLVPISLLAEEQEEINTMFISDVIVFPVINGKSWIKLDNKSRIMYLTRIEDGASLLIAEMGSVQNKKNDTI